MLSTIIFQWYLLERFKVLKTIVIFGIYLRKYDKTKRTSMAVVGFYDKFFFRALNRKT